MLSELKSQAVWRCEINASQVKDFSSVRIGDLLFFDADPDDGTRIDHVGMYLGLDAGNHHRFISSRKGANGPTLGDYKAGLDSMPRHGNRSTVDS